MKLSHKSGSDEYTTLNNLDKAVNQQIIKAVTGPIFSKPLESHSSGYFRVTIRAMIQFLFRAYSNTTPLGLDANDIMMKEKWDPSIPIIYLFSKIQDGVEKADAVNTPYTVNQVLAYTVNQVLEILFNHVFHTGTMQSACQRWPSLAHTNKMWANFQDMFTQVHDTYESLTAQAG
jgi:hypothetical protein